MNEYQKIFLNALNSIPGIGYLTLSKIEEFFNGDFEAVFKANENQLKMAGIENQELKIILNHRKKTDPEKEYKKLEKEGIKMITKDEKEYPRLLKEIPKAPIFFYQKGKLKPEDDFSFGVVGTRMPSSYGLEVTEYITQELALAGLTIVSGLAIGIDALAHKTAIKVKNRTIAVLASGLDDRSIFPKENLYLAKKIIENGAIISEYPVGMGATKEKFHQRNRIISGLSRGILVVEAPLKSGSLITAKLALEQNREVFAVPGNIFSKNSYGPNLLIKQGAKPVTRAQDILEELNLKYQLIKIKRKFKPENELEKIVFETLNRANEPLHIDQIIRESGLPIKKVSLALNLMETKGIVKNLGNAKYMLSEDFYI